MQKEKTGALKRFYLKFFPKNGQNHAKPRFS